MRIIAGSHRGAKLIKLNNTSTRPTTDRIREAIFNILDSGRFGQKLGGALVIDAFAGTGALGLEALSRGAASVFFIAQDAGALSNLRSNINNLNLQNRSQVIAGDATSLVNWSHPPATILFADAPYYSGAGQKAAIRIVELSALASPSIVIMETHKSEKIDQTQLVIAKITHIMTRRYGNTAVHFFVHNSLENAITN